MVAVLRYDPNTLLFFGFLYTFNHKYSIFIAFVAIIFRYLSENPYICDCSLIWFLREPTANKKKIIDYSNMKCASPTKMKGTQLKGLKRENSICGIGSSIQLEFELCSQSHHFCPCLDSP